MIKNFFVLFLFAALLLGFISPSLSALSRKKQGLEGYVYRISGNQMPSPDRPAVKPKGIKTALYIFELTNLSQVSREDHSSFYSSIQTKFIKKVETDTNGYFRIYLPAGHYSLFAKKDSLFYANWFDGGNNIAPIEVLPKKITKVEFKIDYDAYY
jgi:hypothetical protein